MHKKYGVKDIRIIPNAVKPIEIFNRTHSKIIISVGRLSLEKGHKVLIKAFSILNDREWRLEIVGDGPERVNLEKLVLSLGLQKRVFFHGHQKDFKELLAKASLFVLPSFYEGFPNALVEAMSVPLTCIASDCIAGPREIIEHGKNGFLFEPGNVYELTTILKDLTNNLTKIKEVENKALIVREKYDFQQIATSFFNELES
jgi:glycosyltransferase involved in cell wall biosynthesis